MDIKTKELIAIGASVVANCQPCLTYHLNKAKENGADAVEINTAIEVAKMVRKGAMNKMDQFIATVSDITNSNPDITKKDCGCS